MSIIIFPNIPAFCFPPPIHMENAPHRGAFSSLKSRNVLMLSFSYAQEVIRVSHFFAFILSALLKLSTIE